MIKKVLLLLLFPTICFADGIWGTRYNSWTRANDWYKNSVSSSAYATFSGTATYSNNAGKLDGNSVNVFITTTTAYTTFVSTNVPVGISVAQDINMSTSSALNLGDANEEGTWRLKVVSGSLAVQEKVSGVFVTQGYFTSD